MELLRGCGRTFQSSSYIQVNTPLDDAVYVPREGGGLAALFFPYSPHDRSLMGSNLRVSWG